MNKIIAIIGEPGSGKTTLMKKVVEYFKLEPHYKAFKLVPYLSKDDIVVLGKYEEGDTFGGTDKMSMQVQPRAIKFLELLEDKTILFEGDRLGSPTFLEHCIENYDTKVIYLKTDQVVREKRYEERGSNQNKTWLQGRETKISNILTNFNIMFNVTTLENNNQTDIAYNFEEILRIINE